MTIEKKINRAFRNVKKAAADSYMYRAYYQSVDPQLMVFSCHQGKQLSGSVLRTLLAVRETYGASRTCAVCTVPDSEARIRAIADRYHLSGIRFLRFGSAEGIRTMEKAACLFTDAPLPAGFIKRPEQVMVYLYPTTPLLKTGKDSSVSRRTMANLQRNLFMSDFLQFQNRYSMEHVTSAFSMSGLYKGKILICPAPADQCFADPSVPDQLRRELGLTVHRVYLFLPDLATELDKASASVYRTCLLKSLAGLDDLLTDDEVLFIRPELLASVQGQRTPDETLLSLPFRHVRLFPDGIDPYEMLTVGDAMITDHSDLLFSFARTGRKIVRFQPQATDDISFAFDLYDPELPLPFPVAADLPGLLSEVRSPKAYDDQAFLSAFCKGEAAAAPKNLLSQIFGGSKNCEEISLSEKTGENVFVYGGALARNDITTGCLEMLRQTSGEERNYFLSYINKQLSRKWYRLDELPEDTKLIALGNERYYTASEAFCLFLFYVLGLDCRLSRNGLKRYYDREFRRYFSGMDFDTFIQYSGYSNYLTGLLAHADGKRIIFSHTDMQKEISRNKNLRAATLRFAYRTYDKIAVTAGDLLEPVRNLAGKNAASVMHVPPFFDPEGIRERAQLPVEFQERTSVFCADPRGFQHFLDSWNKVFIAIGKFTDEKCYDRLIEAFETVCGTHDDLGLIIIGGYGKAYKQVLEKTAVSDYRKHIALIRNMENPLPILKQCSLLVLSSDYEGLPISILQADALGIPVLSTDCTGCRGFLNAHGGHLVDCSPEGLAAGMEEFLKEGFPLLTISYPAYAADAKQQFKELLS